MCHIIPCHKSVSSFLFTNATAVKKISSFIFEYLREIEAIFENKF